MKNLSNGNVEIIADETIRLIQFCKSNPGFSRVDTITILDYPNGKKLDHFLIS